MLGNVAEWCRGADGKPVVRGGSFEDKAATVSCATRASQTPAWQVRDSQIPKSVWWLSDAPFVGFRVVRVDNDPPKLQQLKSKVTRASPDQ